MTQPATTVVKAGSPSKLITAVPHLLGFTPQNSLVVIGCAPPRDRIQVTLRYDLDPDLADDIADHAVDVLAAQHLKTAIAVGYGPDDLVRPAAAALSDACAAESIDLYDILRVADGRYWSYACDNPLCCGPDGTPVALDDMVLASLSGLLPVLTDRAEVAAKLAHVPDPAVDRAVRAAEILPEAEIIRGGYAAVSRMVAAYRPGEYLACPEEQASVLVGLRHLRIRDDAWARMDPEFARAHLTMWVDLVLVAPDGYVAAPAALLAFVAWQNGDGALANCALDRALADQPGYSMALLLRQIIGSGASPALAVLPVTPEQVAATYA